MASCLVGRSSTTEATSRLFRSGRSLSLRCFLRRLRPGVLLFSRTAKRRRFRIRRLSTRVTSLRSPGLGLVPAAIRPPRTDPATRQKNRREQERPNTQFLQHVVYHPKHICSLQTKKLKHHLWLQNP